MKKFFARKKKSNDLRATSYPSNLPDASDDTPPVSKRPSSLTLGGSSRSSKSFGGGEPKKSVKSILGVKKTATSSGKAGDLETEESRSETARLRNELHEKENKLREMQKTVLESKQKAQDWKEYSNMQRFKAELLADMWALRMANGDSELETLQIHLDG